jgi:hypothetical protein
MGEDLGTMSLKELQCLEQQLDTGLKNIRSRRVGLHSFEFLYTHID